MTTENINSPKKRELEVPIENKVEKVKLNILNLIVWFYLLSMIPVLFGAILAINYGKVSDYLQIMGVVSLLITTPMGIVFGYYFSKDK